jgi:uncharacterized hydrophobic protein (TIGR00271 family)
MKALKAADVERMSDALFIVGPLRGRPSSRFWVLLLLSAIIATAGVVADSTATVIGAMIVAPLMTPILGVALAVVLADRHHLLKSVAFVIGGALIVIAIAYLIGMTAHPVDAYLGNSQVSGRISPKLIDLLAALATGTVGAFALVRSDISDTLPGVAIAISLVPPLAVVGLLLQVGRYEDAAQAGLLFGTNVAAIVATGTIVLLAYRVRDAAIGAGHSVGRISGKTLAIVGGLVVLVAIPLTLGSRTVANDERIANMVRPMAEAWARDAHWQVTTVETKNGTIVVTALGMPPQAQPAKLRAALNEGGLQDANLKVRLVVGGSQDCTAGNSGCEESAPMTAP